jgi:hypothetical protein
MIPHATARAEASIAAYREGSRELSTKIPHKTHNQPSPPRVAAIIHQRTQRGGLHRFTRRMSTRSG